MFLVLHLSVIDSNPLEHPRTSHIACGFTVDSTFIRMCPTFRRESEADPGRSRFWDCVLKDLSSKMNKPVSHTLSELSLILAFRLHPSLSLSEARNPLCPFLRISSRVSPGQPDTELTMTEGTLKAPSSQRCRVRKGIVWHPAFPWRLEYHPFILPSI